MPGLLEFLLEPLHGISRGMSADLLGAPADLAAQVMTVPRMLGANTPDFREYPFMGSRNLGETFERIGLLRPATGTPNEAAARMVGGMLASPAIVGATGSTVESGLAQVLKNAGNPGISQGLLGRQIGAINPQRPFNRDISIDTTIEPAGWGGERWKLSRPAGNGKIDFDVGFFKTADDIDEWGFPYMSFTMSSHNASAGTGGATNLLLDALSMAKREGVGFVSDSILSTESLKLIDRLKNAGVPFSRQDQVFVLTPQQIKQLNIPSIKNASNAMGK